MDFQSKRLPKGRRRLGRPPLQLSEGTRERILDAALSCFASKGYEGTSLKEIAAHLGMEASAIYGHFSSKQEIRLELITRSGPNYMRSELKNLMESQLPPREAMYHAMELLSSHWLNPKERQFFRFLLLDNLESGQASPLSVKSLHRAMHTLIKPVVAQLVANGELKNLDLDWLTRQLLAPIQVMRQSLAFEETLPSQEKLVEDLKYHLTMFLAAFRP